MQFDGLHAVADYAALYALLRQDALAARLDDELGDFRVDADPSGRCLTFSAEGGAAIRVSTTLVAVLDSYSITWGWAHPDGDPVGAASALRETGDRFGIDDFIRPRVMLPGKLTRDDDHDPGEGDLEEATDIVAAAAVQSTGISPYYTVRLDADTRAVYLLDDISVPEPNFVDFATKMPGVMSSISVNDHRVAVHGMAARLGWHISWRSADDAGRSPTCELTDGRSTAQIDFDAQGRPRGYRCDLAA